MSQVLYEASPSMVRMNPFGTVVTVLLLFAGIALASPPVAGVVGARFGLPDETGTILNMVGMGLAALSFVMLITWYVKTKMDKLVIKQDEVVWTHGLLSKQYTEINMSSIRTVRVAQSLFQRIMGAGDVTVFTSGDLPEVVIRGLPNPNLVRDYVKGEAPE
jgi:uncharacterized membrane protein YdbT with pleckstrin-like domain